MMINTDDNTATPIGLDDNIEYVCVTIDSFAKSFPVLEFRRLKHLDDVS